MTRSQFSAAVLLALAAGVTGCCSGSPHIVQQDASGCIVAVDKSSWCQWYYRREAVALIREKYDPHFKESNIAHEGLVETRPMGIDGKPIPTKSPVSEYQIVYQVLPKPTTMYSMPAGGGMPVNPNGMTNSTVMPVSGAVMPPTLPPTGPAMVPANPGYGGQPMPYPPPGYQPTPGYQPNPGAQSTPMPPPNVSSFGNR